jgi:ribosomal protein S27E
LDEVENMEQVDTAPAAAVQVVDNPEAPHTGVTECPGCGSSDIQLNPATGQLHCNMCGREWPGRPNTLDVDVRQLTGVRLGAGAQAIVAGPELMTFKCPQCGAEVVVDTREAPQAQCHWCNSILSVNDQIPNGAVPDVVLPFRLTREQAFAQLNGYVRQYRTFADEQFIAGFTPQAITGVYLPYMVVDVNGHATLKGEAGIITKTHDNENHRTYDVDFYQVERDFDLLINDMTVESQGAYLSIDTRTSARNVIDAVMPFPTGQAVAFDACFLRGFNSERRDMDVNALGQPVLAEIKDIARLKMVPSLAPYTYGTRWDNEDLWARGQLWKTAYLPVWLYAFRSPTANKGKPMTLYVACNGVTGKTTGAIPISAKKYHRLLQLPIRLGIIALVITTVVSIIAQQLAWPTLLADVIDVLFYASIAAIVLGIIGSVRTKRKYRNATARSHYEVDTAAVVEGQKDVDTPLRHEDRLDVGQIKDANFRTLTGQRTHYGSNAVFSTLIDGVADLKNQ